MTLLAQMLDGMVVILLAVVGSLLVWLHFRITTLSRAPQEIQKLSKTVTDTVSEAQQKMADIVKKAQKYGPDLDKNANEAGKLVHELTYVMDRAEKILQQMDEKMEAGNNHVNGHVYKRTPPSKPLSNQGAGNIHSFEQANEQKYARSSLEEAKNLLGRINHGAASEAKMRKAAPTTGTRAYQAAARTSQFDESDSEVELRRVLEGRLS